MANRFEVRKISESGRYLQERIDFVKKRYKRVGFFKRVIRKLFF